MPRPSHTANVNKPFYVKLYFPPQVTLYSILLVDNITQLANLFFAKIF
ncbi:unnamed protein product, partial [marine sediment metagenome]